MVWFVAEGAISGLWSVCWFLVGHVADNSQNSGAAVFTRLVCSFLLLAQKQRTKEKGTLLTLSSQKATDFSGLHELATLKQRAALIRKTTAFLCALPGDFTGNI